jgi:hypothetical protein
VLLLAAHAPADPMPVPADLQQAINTAIDNGVAFLKAAQNPFGTWTIDKNNHPVGYAALAGLTLLECGVPADDPSVQAAAKFVRLNTINADKTYELALSVLFLDKLGVAKDRPQIEILALRLIAGQSPTGGWSYKCPVLNTGQHKGLMYALRSRKINSAKVGADVRSLPVLTDPAKLNPVDPPNDRKKPIYGTTDNSNTQFAVLAVWAARRQGIPVERTLKLILRRFETGQNPDGSWPYDYRFGGGLPDGGPMNCVGLLGLAVGNGLAKDTSAAMPTGPVEALAAAAVGFPAQGPVPAGMLLGVDNVNRQVAVREAVKKGQQDKRILGGFVVLDKYVGQPSGRMKDLKLENLYFLWSIERVAVLYNLPQLGEKDWYRWGAEILVANQKAPGNWEGGGYHGSTPPIDTCLALLFLRRANLASDLTAQMSYNSASLAKGISDSLPTKLEASKPESPPPESSRESPLARAVVDAMTPVQATPTPAPAPSSPPATTSDPPTTRRATREEGGSLVWTIVFGLVALLLVVGGGLFVFFMLRQREEEEEEDDDRPRKAKKKSQARRR